MEASTEVVVYDDYCFTFPLWTLVNSKTLKSLGLAKSLVVTDHVVDNAMSLFTEEEFADRFVAASTGEVTPLKLCARHELEQLLLSYCRLGGKFIAIDPTFRANSPDYRQLACPARGLLRAVIKASAGLD
jgi:hypothetical protein